MARARTGLAFARSGIALTGVGIALLRLRSVRTPFWTWFDVALILLGIGAMERGFTGIFPAAGQAVTVSRRFSGQGAGDHLGFLFLRPTGDRKRLQDCPVGFP